MRRKKGRSAEHGFGNITRVLAALGLTLRLEEAIRGRPTLEDLVAEADEAA
jgi:hypothetical protein